MGRKSWNIQNDRIAVYFDKWFTPWVRRRMAQLGIRKGSEFAFRCMLQELKRDPDFLPAYFAWLEKEGLVEKTVQSKKEVA